MEGQTVTGTPPQILTLQLADALLMGDGPMLNPLLIAAGTSLVLAAPHVSFTSFLGCPGELQKKQRDDDDDVVGEAKEKKHKG
jgi:hypothetical protein